MRRLTIADVMVRGTILVVLAVGLALWSASVVASLVWSMVF